MYVYITGYGNINWNKLYIALSAREFLVENELSEEELIDESEGSEHKNKEDTRRETLTIDQAFKQRKIAGKVTVRMLTLLDYRGIPEEICSNTGVFSYKKAR